MALTEKAQHGSQSHGILGLQVPSISFVLSPHKEASDVGHILGDPTGTHFCHVTLHTTPKGNWLLFQF